MFILSPFKPTTLYFLYTCLLYIFFFKMKTLVILFAIGLMSPLLCEGLGLCMTACNSDFCEGGCKIKGYFSGMCSSDLSCPRGRPMICNCV